jgi:hypothetical protein
VGRRDRKAFRDQVDRRDLEVFKDHRACKDPRDQVDQAEYKDRKDRKDLKDRQVQVDLRVIKEPH